MIIKTAVRVRRRVKKGGKKREGIVRGYKNNKNGGKKVQNGFTGQQLYRFVWSKSR